jgi:hypothetical protein
MDKKYPGKQDFRQTQSRLLGEYRKHTESPCIVFTSMQCSVYLRISWNQKTVTNVTFIYLGYVIRKHRATKTDINIFGLPEVFIISVCRTPKMNCAV